MKLSLQAQWMNKNQYLSIDTIWNNSVLGTKLQVISSAELGETPEAKEKGKYTHALFGETCINIFGK